MIRLSGIWPSALPIVLIMVSLALLAFSQDEIPVFRTQAASAFVWGQNNISGTVSTSIQDPLNGNVIHAISYDGITVSSRAAFQRSKLGQAGELLSFSTTIANHRESKLSVRQGRATVDGLNMFPLPALPLKRPTRGERDQVHQLVGTSCLSNESLPDEIVLASEASSNTFTVVPGKGLTISLITKDPRYYSILCSADGCYPKRAIRFYVTVNSMDFVFIWPGREMSYCEK